MEYTNPDRKPLSSIIEDAETKGYSILVIGSGVDLCGRHAGIVQSMLRSETALVICAKHLLEKDQVKLGVRKSEPALPPIAMIERSEELNRRALVSMEELIENIVNDASLRMQEDFVEVRLEKPRHNNSTHLSIPFKTSKGFKKTFKINRRP